MNRIRKYRPSRSAWLSSVALLIPLGSAWAGPEVDAGLVRAPVETIVVEANLAAKPLSETPLEATQPTSVVSREFLELVAPPTGNYDDAIKFTPSVSNVEPNGPGLQESKFLSIRGFQDGQYNITFDGIPYLGTPTDFHHVSSVYFTDHILNTAEVDRGPGTAATVGVATFGGTINLTSRATDQRLTGDVYGTYGSFNTSVVGARVDTGRIDALGGASAYIDASTQYTNGYLTDSSGERSNIFFKAQLPLGESTMLTVAALDNHTRQHVPKGATQAQIAQYGDDYGLNLTPNSNANADFNHISYGTDFEYIGLQSDLGEGWAIDNKIYTNAFYKTGFQTSDVNGAPAGTLGSTYLCSKTVSSKICGFTPTKSYYLNGVLTTLDNDLPGQIPYVKYRSEGDILRIQKDVGFGDVNVGIWADHTEMSDYAQPKVDVTAGGVPYTTSATASPYSYKLKTGMNTYQPYAELDWKPLPGLTVTGGVKYSMVTRNVDALIDSGTGLPANESQTWTSVLPALSAHYAFTDSWTAYAQVAKGFLAPPLNALYTVSVPASVAPEKTWNYQIGTSWKSDRLTLSADLYYIKFDNFYTSTTDALKDVIYVNDGGAVYKGIEIEGSFVIGDGFSLYGNGSLNSATFTSGQWVAMAPRQTAALGLVYSDRSGLFGSLIGKYTGPQFGQNAANSAQTDQYPIGAYEYADFAIGYRIKEADMPDLPLREATLRLQIGNIFDDHSLIALQNTTNNAAGQVVPLYWINPGRSIFVSAEAKF